MRLILAFSMNYDMNNELVVKIELDRKKGVGVGQRAVRRGHRVALLRGKLFSKLH